MIIESVLDEKDISSIMFIVVVCMNAGKLDNMAKKKKPEQTNINQSVSTGGVVIGGNVDHGVVVPGNNVVTINYYTADGEKRELRTGWFFGHRYGDLENFTGRFTEIKMLNEWLGNDKDNLLMLRALGGFGKSALAWTWFNRVDRELWPTAVWWSFYEKESGFETFLSETLKHLGVEVKQSARQQVNDLLEAMRGTNILIVLDGFERLLRQYGRMDAALQSDDEDADIDPSQRDCSSPLTETFLRGLSGAGTKSRVLMTTRLCPRVLESRDGKLLKGCREEPLTAFSPEDAVAYFHNEGIKATRAEIIEVCSAYGYHPLSLFLLVGLINQDSRHRGDIEAVKGINIFGDITEGRYHILERAYQTLAPERRDLLSMISCFRGSMEYAVLKKVFPSADLDKALLDLRNRGLLQYAGETHSYDMHPIVRHYAYDHFTDEKRRKEAHVQLATHFIDAMPVANKKVKKLEDLAPVVELYHHMVGAGNLDEAVKLLSDRLVPNPLHYRFGAYQLQIELLRVLFLDGEDKPPRLKDKSYQEWILGALARAYSLSGQPRRAVPLFELQIDLQERSSNKKNLAVELESVASTALLPLGSLSVAERNLRRSIEYCREINDSAAEIMSHQELGRVLSYRGVWQEAGQELDKALELAEKQKNVQVQGATWSHRALLFLLMARGIVSRNESSIGNLKSAIECAQRALEFIEKTARTQYGAPRDYVRAYWLLGAAHRANNELTLAEENLSKALNVCRQINLVEMEADILLDLAQLRYAHGDFRDAKEKASEALVITERSGYVLQGADVNLFLAQYALEQEKDNAKAKVYAEEAKKLATCDGSPYYYKVAYEESLQIADSKSEETLSKTAYEETLELHSCFSASLFSGNLNMRNVINIKIASTPELRKRYPDVGDVTFLVTAPGLYMDDGQNKVVVPMTPNGISVDLELRAHLPGSYQIKIEPFVEKTPYPLLLLDVTVSNKPVTENIKLPNPLKPRSAPQPEICLRTYISLISDIGEKIKIEYILYSPVYSLHFPGSTPAGSVTLKISDLKRILARLEKVVSIESVDGNAQNLSSIGKELYDLLFPDDLKKNYLDISNGKVRNILILSDPSLWIPWELLKPYGNNWEHEHLGQRYNLGRWIEGWGTLRQDEFPIGQVCLVGVSEYSKHYSLSEWGELLCKGDISRLDNNLFVEWLGGIPVAMEYQTPIWGLHFEDIPDALVEKSGEMVKLDDKPLSPENVRAYALNLHTKRPLVTFGMRSQNNISAFTHLEENWLPVFIQSGASAFIGTFWAVQPEVDQLFWRVFYQEIWNGLAIGEAVNIARQRVSEAYPESIGEMSYYLVGDPMSVGYLPPLGEAFVTLECLEHDINLTLLVGKKYTFQAAIRNSPPIWHKDRLHQSKDTKWAEPKLQVISSACEISPSNMLAFAEISPDHWICRFELTPKEPKHLSVDDNGDEDIFFNYLSGTDMEIRKSIALPLAIKPLEVENGW